MDVARMQEVTRAWIMFSELSASLQLSDGVCAGVHKEVEWASCVETLGNQGLSHIAAGHFLGSLERTFKDKYLQAFWTHFDGFQTLQSESIYSLPATAKLNEWVRTTLPQALAEIFASKSLQEQCLNLLAQVFNFDLPMTVVGDIKQRSSTAAASLFSQYQTSICSLLLMSAPKYFEGIINSYFKARLEEFNSLVKKDHAGDEDFDVDASEYSMGNHTEDDESESGGKSGWSSMSAKDMELNGDGCPYKETSELGDGAAVQMEGIDEMTSDCNLRKVSTMDEVVRLAGEDWVTEVGSAVRHLGELGYTSFSEEGYSSAIYCLLKEKIHSIANKQYEKPVLLPVRQWIEDVPLRFLYIILAFSGSPSVPFLGVPRSLGTDTTINEGIMRWRSRFQSFAYETLGDLRVSELFDIIVDFPESLPAIEDLKESLANTGDHSKLINSFRDALQQRLLTAGAATTDILLQYISTIKALRTLDPTGVVLEAVGEPVKEYLRGRKDTIRCIVTMLTDDTGAGATGALGGVGESLLEELSTGTFVPENADSEDDGDLDGDEAWAAAECWEPDPVDANPSRTSKSRRSMDVIGILIGIYGSKELFVNEYRVMLAEKLLNKSDYETDRNIRTLELLKLRFGESNMQGCEIMLKDVSDSKRINSNIKAAYNDSGSKTPEAAREKFGSFPLTDHIATPGGPAFKDHDQELSLEVVDATIISSLFWPLVQAETVKLPDKVDQLLDKYAEKYHALKAPRKLQWKKHLGTVKLELQFKERSTQFVVSPVHASIIMQFQDQSSWAASDLANAVGIPVSTLRRRIMLWVNQGVLVESSRVVEGESEYTIVENPADVANWSSGPTVTNDSALPLLGEDEEENALASMEDQWQQEMNVFESYVVGMLTNFESLPLDRIHNMLKMFVSDPPYDKTIVQLQGFLARLISEEKLEFHEGSYWRRTS